MSTENVRIPKNLGELQSMSQDDIRYLAQRDRIPNKLAKQYGEDKIREILDGESQIPPAPSIHTMPVPESVQDAADTNDLSTWSNKALRGEIVTLSEQLGEEPELDGKKADLVARVEDLRARVDEESDDETDDDEGDDDSDDGNGEGE